MAFCVNCGAKLDESSRFCIYCGSPVLNQESDKAQETAAEDISVENIQAATNPYAVNPYANIIPETPVKKTPLPLIALLCGCAALVLSILSAFFIDMRLYTLDVICCFVGIIAGLAAIPLAIVGFIKGKKTKTGGATFKCILAVIIAIIGIDIILHF